MEERNKWRHDTHNKKVTWPSSSHFHLRHINVNSTRYRITKVICHILWIIFCSVGLSYHLATICDGYFKYSVTTETVIQIPQIFTPPALSVCFTITDIIRVDLLNETSPCYTTKSFNSFVSFQPTTTSSSSETCSTYLSTLSMDKVNDLTYNFDDIFDTIWYRDPDDYNVITVNATQSLDDFYIYSLKHVTSLFKNDLKCFTINTTANFTKNYYETLLVSDADTEGSVLSLGLKVDEETPTNFPIVYQNNEKNSQSMLTHPSVLKIFTHSIHHAPRGYIVPPVVCNLTENSDVTIVYHRVANRLLPPPFQSACRNYNDPNESGEFHDQLECIEICLDNSPGDGFLDKTTIKSINSTKRSRPTSSTKTRHECVKKCPLPCERINYMSRLAGWLGQPQGNDATITLGSGEPDILVQFKPRTQPFEFVIFVASCFNLWFGVSVYGSTLDFCRKSEIIFLQYIARQVDKCNQVEKTNKYKQRWWKVHHLSIFLSKCKQMLQRKRNTTGPLIGVKRSL